MNSTPVLLGGCSGFVNHFIGHCFHLWPFFLHIQQSSFSDRRDLCQLPPLTVKDLVFYETELCLMSSSDDRDQTLTAEAPVIPILPHLSPQPVETKPVSESENGRRGRSTHSPRATGSKVSDPNKTRVPRTPKW